MSQKHSDNFNTICDLFCHLGKVLKEAGYKDISEIIDCLMSVWLDTTLIK